MDLHEQTTPHLQLHLVRAYRELGETLRTSASESLRRAAIAADSSATLNVDISLLWHELAVGSCRITDGFLDETRCYLIVEQTPPDLTSSLRNARLQILQGVLVGMRQKNLAIDRRLAASTVASHARLGLHNLGLPGKPSRAHPLLMLAARAATESRMTLARCSIVTYESFDRRVFSVPRPELFLQSEIPTAELEVLSGLIEGLSHEEIAERRTTSVRTVANQISSIFRRMHVSGRNELVQRLFSNQSREGAFRVVSGSVTKSSPVEPEPNEGLGLVRRSA
jgi:DNA-binding CsgD family transcriptional regulator